MSVRVYQYEKCQSCRKALAFLEKRRVAHTSVPIAERPPSKTELREMLRRVGDLKRLFNTSGKLYRELRISERLKKMTEAAAIDLLSKNGMLVKRPFVLTKKAALVGFKEAEWKKAFA